ncbi:MAG: molecular chaperone DnaK [Curvibacter sp. PD_MW3]|nr:MAG: molecular chaperone DnaK [Curvibacter sp. PD_MW3]
MQQDLAQIELALVESVSATATVMLDQSSVGRLSRMDALQQQALAQEMRGRLQLSKRKLEAAMVRLDAGRYGLCCDCGEPMEADRLDRDPAAIFCLECMSTRI